MTLAFRLAGVIFLAALPLSVHAQRAAAVDPAEWKIDSQHSSAEFSVTHMLVSRVKGQLGPVAGKIWFDATNIAGIRAEATIDVSKISTGDPDRDAHLKTDDFFNVSKFPVMTFKSKKATAADAGHFSLVGDLTIRDVTKEVTLIVDGPSAVIKAQGMSRVAAEATTTINRFDYGLRWNNLIEAGGGAIVGPDVKITVTLEATKR